MKIDQDMNITMNTANRTTTTFTTDTFMKDWFASANTSFWNWFRLVSRHGVANKNLMHGLRTQACNYNTGCDANQRKIAIDKTNLIIQFPQALKFTRFKKTRQHQHRLRSTETASKQIWEIVNTFVMLKEKETNHTMLHMHPNQHAC